VAIHSLKGGGDDPLFWGWHHEFVVAYLLRHSSSAKPLCHSDVFARLAQTTVMDLDRLPDMSYAVVELLGQSITPGAYFQRGLEVVFHNATDYLWIAGGVKVEIVTNIGPVVEAFHDGDLNTGILKLGTEFVQEGQRLINRRPLLQQSFITPFFYL
jgi:hypothetical protein